MDKESDIHIDATVVSLDCVWYNFEQRQALWSDGVPSRRNGGVIGRRDSIEILRSASAMRALCG